MKTWDKLSVEFAADHGWRFDKSEKLLLSKEQFVKHRYTGTFVHDPSVKAIMLPCVHGCCIAFEGKHFRIIN